MSYIIKNCPALISTQYQCLCFQNRHIDCQQISDCLLKQIANKCKRASQNDLHFTPSEVLSLLDIKECEE